MDSKFEQLVSILEPDYNPDYWEDVVKVDAGVLLDTLQDDEWERLLNTWQSKPATWCVHLVEASLLSDKPRVMPLLVAMLKRPEGKVGGAVATMLLEKGYQWSPEESLVADLQRHLQLVSGLDAQAIQRLLLWLPN